MIHHVKAGNAKEVAALLRTRGRIIITAPARCGATTELIRYGEERYPNGRFAVVAKEEHHAYITKLHWRIYNGISMAEVVAKRLLGEKLEGEDVNPPRFISPEIVWARVFNPSTPTLVDGWNSLTSEAQKEIIKHRLFIAAIN